jgi:lipoprotein-releasing system ATP-binding protein
MNEPGFILEAHDVYKIYQTAAKDLTVLKGIDLSVKAGESLAITGPSGAGKSTLLHLLGGLDKPTRGTVVFSGVELQKIGEQERCKIRNSRMGFIFQFYHLLPEFSALENLVLPALIKNQMQKRKILEQKGMDLLEQVGLKERAHHRPAKLSGGEQQRVAIARALMNKPEIVFCDEPTGNLDSKTGGEIIKLLWELNSRNQQTLVIVTHDEHIARLSSRVLHIQDGKLLN